MSKTQTEAEFTDAHFNTLQALVYKNTGITIAENRKSMLFSRLRGRLRELNTPDFETYISRVNTDKEEKVEFIDRITTNKTYFYRTPRVWEHFEETVVPDHIARGSKRQLRVWSAAASTGEEAHTIGVLLESVRLAEKGFDYSVMGTDVSRRVVKVAETGCYAKAAVTQFQKSKPDLFEAHMEGNDTDGYKVSPKIKSRIRFSEHNLQNRLKSSTLFDAVFLRNVLIYFAPEDQENILRHVHHVLSPEGFLYIGESETITRLNTDFELVAPMIYRPLPAVSKSDPQR